MRVSVSRRRRWNNILILGIIAFIGLLNAPTLIKTYLIDEPTSAHPRLLNPEWTVTAMYFSDWSLESSDGVWSSSLSVNIEPKLLVERWASLEGTLVDDTTFSELKPNLNSPESIEVWYFESEEPQRITFYRLPEFWLLRNYESQWIAVSVAENILLPSVD